MRLLPLNSRVPPPSTSTQLSLDPAWWTVRLQRHEGDAPKTPLPALPRAPQHAKSGAQRDEDLYLICWYFGLGLAPLARTSEARVQPVKCSLSSLKGFRGGEGWEGASSKNKFSRKRQLVSTLSRSISRYSY